MHTLRILCLATVFCLGSLSASAQQSVSSDATSGPQSPQAASILQQSLAALTGSSPVNDVTMRGAVTITLGSATQSGTMTLVATASGQGQLTLNLPLGTQTEIRSVSANGTTLMAAGSDGVFHSVDTASALAPHPALFYPALLLASGLSSSQYASNYIGQETRYGATVNHIAVWLAQSSPYRTVGQQRPGQHDIYIDAASGLPLGITFTAHPYDPVDPDRQLRTGRANVYDCLEEVFFSDYRQVNGLEVAFHVQTRLYQPSVTVVADIQFSQVTFNSGAVVAAN